jgi:sialic acid synthase SpsE
MLIAEIGNNHLGDIEKAKDMIRAANDHGADIVKAQAFKAEDVTTGSMPKEFYEMCQLTEEEYISLIHYAREIGTDLFYSIFSNDLENIAQHQNYRKTSAGQVKQGVDITCRDFKESIISVPYNYPIHPVKEAQLLYASDYLTEDPYLSYIQILKADFSPNRAVGYSDHCLGVVRCQEAFKYYGAKVIEKHFTLDRDIVFKGQVFRDSIHSADPKQLEELAITMKK